MRWAGDVACIEGNKVAYRGNLREKGHLEELVVDVKVNVNILTPNDPYRDRNAPPTSKSCILYIYSTNIITEHFKHGTNSPFFSLQNAVCFIILMYLVPVLFTFYIFIQQI